MFRKVQPETLGAFARDYGVLREVCPGALRQMVIAADLFERWAGGPVRLDQLDERSVSEWLRSLSPEDRRVIGTDLATVQFGWPVGMPLCRPLGQGLWEVRSRLSGSRIARILFFADAGRLGIVHGFLKTTQKTPSDDLALARKRMMEMKT